jgi:hypothetical protein
MTTLNTFDAAAATCPRKKIESLPKGVTDCYTCASNGTLDFDEGKYSVTVSAQGTAIQHIAANQTHMGF